MAKIHNLDIYPHTGGRSCLGCVEVENADAPEDEMASRPPSPVLSPQQPASPPESRRAAPPPSFEMRMVPELPPVLLRARWLRGTAPVERAQVGERLALDATAHNAPGTTASFALHHLDSGETVSIEGPIEEEHALTEWTPSRAGAYRFEVTAGGARATSPLLQIYEAAEGPALKLRHIGSVLRTLWSESRVVARWFLEDLSYEHLCRLAEQGACDPENDAAHMLRELCLLPGMEGDDVREAQQALTALGHFVEATGVFDVATKKAMLAWLPAVQPDRENVATATRQRVAPSDTFAGVCASHRISDWTDLWEDQGPGLEDDPDLPGGRSFLVPPRAQRGRGRDLLGATGRDTAPAYGGLAYVAPVERLTRTLTFEDGVVVEPPSWFVVETETGEPLRLTSARVSLHGPRGVAPVLCFRERGGKPSPED